jgi:hypothetical protein
MLPLLLAAPLALSPLSGTKIDAFFQDWAQEPALRLLTQSGHCGGTDLAAVINVGFTAKDLRFAAQVVDDRALGGGETTGDGLALRFVLPNGKTRALQVVLNDFEPPHGPSLRLDGRPYKRGKVVATTRVDGWAVELSMPLRDLPGWLGGPRRFAAVISDADADPTEAEGVCTTARLNAEGWPIAANVNFGGPEPYFAQFMAERSDTGHVRDQETLDLDGDGTDELVVLTGRDLFVGGPDITGSPGYVYFTHGWQPDAQLLRFEALPLGKKRGTQVLIEHSEWAVAGETQITIAEIYALQPDGLQRVFAQQTGESAPAWHAQATAKLQVRAGRRGPSLRVGPAKVQGFNPGNLVNIGGENPPFVRLPWPWDHPKGTTWGYTKGRWTQLK